MVVSYHPSARVSLQARSLQARTGWLKSEDMNIEFARETIPAESVVNNSANAGLRRYREASHARLRTPAADGGG